MNHRSEVRGAGLGLRRSLLSPFAQAPGSRDRVDFLEVAPENWMHLGGALGRTFREWTEAKPFVCHGLSLDIGGPRPLDRDFLRDLRSFLDTHGIRDYTEHLSACGDEFGHLYDLMPIPFTEDAVRHVAERVGVVQDLLGMRIALENVSYYAQPGAEMSEAEFVTAVIETADCGLLLDVNNIVVNAINHRYDPLDFLDRVPLDRVRYLHVAGHHEEAPDLRVDTHGADICTDVWALLDEVYRRLGPVPTLLERDFNFPPLQDLLAEVARVRAMLEASEAVMEERRRA
ncbi:DUF692 domain-containing protein [Thioalkalivibrio nitratireducens]|nr:DUF692 domain-containing protein [Thioalkalivibrio nitratireducens]